MATGENFMMIHWASKKAQKVKANKAEEQRIRTEIKNLLNQIEELYNNDEITDEELFEIEAPIRERINKLIDSLY